MITIRHAQNDDMDTVYDMIMALAAQHEQTKYFTARKDDLAAATFGKHPRFRVLLAELQEKPVGYLSYTINYSIWSGSDYINIDDIFVLGECRGMGAGAKLMYAARDICAEHSANLVRWEVDENNHKAIAFYEKLGAEIINKGVCRWSL